MVTGHYLRWRMPLFMRQCWVLLHKLAQYTRPQGWEVNAALLSLINEACVNVCCATLLLSQLGPACVQARSSNPRGRVGLLLKLRMMEVVATSGALRRAKLQSNRHHQQINTHCFTCHMSFLSPNQQCQSERQIKNAHEKHLHMQLLMSFRTYLEKKTFCNFQCTSS